MIGNSKYFDEAYLSDSLNLSNDHLKSINTFSPRVFKAPQLLAEIGAVLADSLSTDEKNRRIFQNMPWSGIQWGFIGLTLLNNTVEEIYL